MSFNFAMLARAFLLVSALLFVQGNDDCRTCIRDYLERNVLGLFSIQKVSRAEYWPIPATVVAEHLTTLTPRVRLCVYDVGSWGGDGMWHQVVSQCLTNVTEGNKPVILLIDIKGATSLSQVPWVEGFCKMAKGVSFVNVKGSSHLLHQTFLILTGTVDAHNLLDANTRPAFIARLGSFLCLDQCGSIRQDSARSIEEVIPHLAWKPDEEGPKRDYPEVFIQPGMGHTRLPEMRYEETLFDLFVETIFLILIFLIWLVGVLFSFTLWQWLVCLAFLVSVVYKLLNNLWVRSRAIEYMMHKPDMVPEVVRTTFNTLPWVDSRVPINHTHGIAAADRSSASHFIDRFGDNIGKKVFYYQRSRSDERNGRMGSRSYFWVKDLNAQVTAYNRPKGSMIAMVDVDQYLDMSEFLCGQSCPTILYTFQPTEVSRENENYSYTFNKDNEVKYIVTGGGIYSHKVWNYSVDDLLVVKTFCCIPYQATAYLINRRSTSQDHEVILLTPLGTWNYLMAWIAVWALSASLLRRLEVCVKSGFLRLYSYSSEGCFVSTGRPGELASTIIPIKTDDTIATLARISKYDLTMPQVQSYVDGDKMSAAILVDYHRNVSGGDKAPVICPVEEGVRRYQFDPKRYEPSDKATLVSFMSPFIHAAYAPDRSVANEERCINGRVNEVRNKILKMTPFMTRVMHEFAEAVIDVSMRNTLFPTDDDEVRSRQNKPTQRKIYEQNIGADPKRVVQMFVKKEAYQKVTDPRAISQINGVDKREYSKYMYSLEQILKGKEWYAFGKVPMDVAQRVVDVVSQADSVVNTDFSRFDGHGSNLMRELEKILLLKAFRPEYHSEICELHGSQQNLKAYAPLGTKYNTGFSRASGSPETSIFNSLVNAFVAFYALRMTVNQYGNFCNAHEAYSRLGIYGGDDGLTADIDPAVYKEAAKRLGQVLTVEPLLRGSFGVKFLGRIYSPYVWEGQLDSCCDLRRQLSKFHVTVNLDSNVTPKMKLLEKARSFLQSDRNTPVLGDFCRRIEQINGGKINVDPRTSRITSWLALGGFADEKQYPNAPAQWMIDYMIKELPNIDYIGFLQWIDRCQTIEDLMLNRLLEEPCDPVVSHPAVVSGELFPRDSKVFCIPDVVKPDGFNDERKVESKYLIPEGKHDPKPRPTLLRGDNGLLFASQNCDYRVGSLRSISERSNFVEAPMRSFAVVKYCPVMKVVSPVAGQRDGGFPLPVGSCEGAQALRREMQRAEVEKAVAMSPGRRRWAPVKRFRPKLADFHGL